MGGHQFDHAKQLIDEHCSLLKKNSYLRLLFDLYQSAGDLAKAKDTLEKRKPLVTWSGEYTLYDIYLALKEKNFKRAYETCKRYLETINFNIAAEEPLINYEFSGSKISGKIHKDRLEEIYARSPRKLTRAAAAALLGDKDRALENLEKEVEEDQTSKYLFKDWPVFENLANEARFKKLYENFRKERFDAKESHDVEPRLGLVVH